MNPSFRPPNRDFIGKPAPPGYIAGVGRGATGFTTRSDIGPARDSASTSSFGGHDDGPARKLAKRTTEDDDEEDENLNESNYDEFAGYGGSLFNKDPYDESDEEADKTYEAVDKHLDERGKSLREAKAREDLEKFRQVRPKIQQQFSDIKPLLKQVSEEEWMSIPEVGDARNRKQRVARQDKFTPVPDSLLAHQAKLARGGEKLVYIDPRSQLDDDDGMEYDQFDQSAPGPSKTSNDSKAIRLKFDESVNIDEMSEFRSSYMSMKLSRASNSSGDIEQVKTDPKDYLTNLQSQIPDQITDESTIKEFRKYLTSLRTSNPTLGHAWIASVRFEEAAGKLKTARDLILLACKQCPNNEDVWLEASRLHSNDVAKSLMVVALKDNPKNQKSEKLWIKAADLEQDDEAKRRVFAKAREIVPKSVTLWKKSVELERDRPNEARVILREAVECCPNAVELWLALARLEPYEEAQRVLIRASEKNPTDRSIWITAAKLEEAAGYKAKVGAIVKRSIEQSKENGIEIKRDEWFKEAADADKAKFKVTCSEIIKRMIGWNIQGDKNEKLKIWLEDAKKFSNRGNLNCARAIYEYIVNDKHYCKLESVWEYYANFERQYANRESLINLLKRAVLRENCMKSEKIWLLLAELYRDDLNESRQILSDASSANPDSEKIILAAVELECENRNFKEARRILADACMLAKTEQLVLRSAKLEWSLGNLDEAVRMLKTNIDQFKTADLHLMLGQIEEERNNYEQAKKVYAEGLKYNPTSAQLWISMARIVEKTENFAKARSKLETACLRNPTVPLLWLEAIRLEIRAFESIRSRKPNSKPNVATLFAKGISKCKDSPDLDLLLSEQSELKKKRYV